MNGVTRTYANNSIVTRTDIGIGSAALLCTTTNPSCCSSVNNGTHWYFPNGSRVMNDGRLPYYRTRSNTRSVTPQQAVRLNRNPQGTTTGIFRCAILDDRGVLQSLYVTIYDGKSCTLCELVVRGCNSRL